MVFFLSLWASSERQNILQENLNCHAVHPHVTITYEKVRFNKSRRAVLTVCVTDHQHCSRNPIFTSGLSLQPHHLWRICYFFWAGGGGEEALSKWHLISLWGIPFQVGESKTTNVLHLSCGQKREGGGGSADFWRRHTLEILIRSHQVQCGQMEANSLINSCTCHTLRSHRQRLSFCFTVDGHFLSFFFLSPFPSLLPSLAGRIKFNCIVYDRYEVRFGTDSRQTVHRHFMVSFHLSCWCVVVTHLTKTIQDAGLVGGGTACMSTQTDTAENELKQNFLHRPIFNFQQPLTAPSSMPSSTSYYPILGQVWLVESKTVRFAAWALFFHALVCSAVVAPRWPPTHSNLIISWMGLEERCQICAICCFGVRQIEVSLENRKVWFAVSWLNKQHNVGLSGDEYNQFDLGPSVKL